VRKKPYLMNKMIEPYSFRICLRALFCIIQLIRRLTGAGVAFPSGPGSAALQAEFFWGKTVKGQNARETSGKSRFDGAVTHPCSVINLFSGGLYC
jgi:hypothetical protein